MNHDTMMYSELVFNGLYLAVIWWLVISMWRRRRNISENDLRIPKYLLIAFFLLALGDTGHVGFRLIAYAMGDLGASPALLGYPFPLVGAGALSTGITITLFYMFLVAVWKLRFGEKAYGPYLAFQMLGIARLVIMVFPQNEWANVVPPQEWSLYRNLPLMLVGFGLVSHLFLSQRKEKDAFFTRLAWLILASFIFYLPVVLYIQKLPMLGMLMIPKTLAYVWMGFLVRARYFRN